MTAYKKMKALPFISHEPLRVLVNRNGVAESIHEVDIVVCDAYGEVHFGMGSYSSEIFPRSAMKPLQAIALIEMLNQVNDLPVMTAAEVALICASHNGEESHSNAVKTLLKKFDISPEALICGAHWSLEQESLIEQVRTIEKPHKTHNNCSGKHAGMLILAKLMTGNTNNYAEIYHEAQQKILDKLQIMTDSNLLSNVTAIDGCGAPAYRAPLKNWARAFALFSGGGNLPVATKEACLRLNKSIAAHPYFVAGRNRACSAVNEAYREKIMVKVGAEGVYSAAFHEFKLGLMLKTRDGNKRGAEVALGAVFRALGYAIKKDVRPYFFPEINNWAGKKVGDVTLQNLSF